MNKNTFLDDYSYTKELGINMAISGKFLAKRSLNLDINQIINNLDKYPSQELKMQVINKICKNYNIKDNNRLILGPGANGILQNLLKIFLKNGGNIVTPELTFKQAIYGAISLNGQVIEAAMNKDFGINLQNIKNCINFNTKAVFICNPNNPTGCLIDCDELLHFCDTVNCVVIVDEAGIEFANSNSLLDYDLPDNVIVLRSFSKSHGLSSLRVGFAICSREIKSLYLENTTNNELSTISLIILDEALNCSDSIQNVKRIIEEREFLEKELKLLGIFCCHSRSNTLFFIKPVTQQFLNLLESHDVSVVPILYKQEWYIRISIQEHQTNQKFINVIQAITGEYK